MTSDTFTLSLIAMIIVFTIYTRSKFYNEYKKEIEDVENDKSFKKVFLGRNVYIVYALVLSLLLIAAVAIFILREQITDANTYLMVLAVGFTIVATDLIRVKILYTTYYNDYGLYVGSDYVRYKSIDKINQNNSVFTTEVVTFKNEKHSIPNKIYELIKDKISSK